MHLESAKLDAGASSPGRCVPRGTTAVVCDPHEIANVLGVEGVRWLLDATEGLPLDVFVMAPSCVPASAVRVAARPARRRTTCEAILRHPRALGVAEMMNFPGVIAGDPDVLARMRRAARRRARAGRRGPRLDAYVAAGISTDHEAFTAEEALEKRRRGMWVLIREASNARNLRALLPLVREHGPDYCAFCTDDREPDFLLPRGAHRPDVPDRGRARASRRRTCSCMASLHGARCHRLLDRGAIAPGYAADLVLLDDLRRFSPVAGPEGRPRAGATAPADAAPVPLAATRCARVPVARVRHSPGRAGTGARDRDPARAADHRRARASPPSRRRVVADPRATWPRSR